MNSYQKELRRRTAWLISPLIIALSTCSEPPAPEKTAGIAIHADDRVQTGRTRVPHVSYPGLDHHAEGHPSCVL